ncbi:MAG TPA: hypothetical protein VF016_02560 [Nitrososphaera sp.]
MLGNRLSVNRGQKISTRDVIYQVLFTYSIYVGGVVVGFNANDIHSWWYQGAAIFTAVAILVFSVYNVKTLRDLEIKIASKNEDKSLKAEVEALRKRIEELESKNVKV